nr:helix-turn-helix transcriptional regulator [Bordetella ansorpii]
MPAGRPPNRTVIKSRVIGTSLQVETFGQRLRLARLKAGWTQKELATASGLTQSAIGNYESGQRREPAGASLIRLSQALQVTAEWLSQGQAFAEDGETSASASGSGSRARTFAPSPWPFREVSPEDCASLTASERRTLEALISTFVKTCRERR